MILAFKWIESIWGQEIFFNLAFSSKNEIGGAKSNMRKLPSNDFVAPENNTSYHAGCFRVQ